MATITIRNLDESVKRKLQVRAALNGRSMEAEARELLSEFVELGVPTETASGSAGFANHDRSRIDASKSKKEGLGTAIHNLFAPLGGVELEIPPRRKSHRQIPTFEE